MLFFEVPFYDSDELTTASITITNLNATSRAGIVKNQVVILNAGYEGDVGALFVGQVASVSHKQSGTEPGFPEGTGTAGAGRPARA